MVPVEAPHEIDLTDPSPVVPRGWKAAPVIVVGIVDEHEMFALGIRTCLAESALVRVAPVVDDDVDVVIVSPSMAEERQFGAPLVICGDPPKRLAPGNEVMAVLGRASLTADHLLASIHAAAAGLPLAAGLNHGALQVSGRKGAEGMTGDGIAVAANIAAFADSSRLLASRAFREALADAAPGREAMLRPAGTFTRQVFLGETLDPEHIDADYTAGVLRLSIPVREAAKPRKVAISSGETAQAISA